MRGFAFFHQSIVRASLSLCLIVFSAAPGLADWTCDDIEIDQEITAYNDGGTGSFLLTNGNGVEASAGAASIYALPNDGADIEFPYNIKRRYIFSGVGGGHWAAYDFWLSAAASAEGEWPNDTGIGYGYAAAGPGETDLISASIVGTDTDSDSDSLTDEHAHPLVNTAFVTAEIRVKAMANSTDTGKGSGSASATPIFVNNL